MRLFNLLPLTLLYCFTPRTESFLKTSRVVYKKQQPVKMVTNKDIPTFHKYDEDDDHDNYKTIHYNDTLCTYTITEAERQLLEKLFTPGIKIVFRKQRMNATKSFLDERKHLDL